ncbi:MAG: hypothetical protein GY801_19630 [bacterium]|nr:hypothetical protein [bacterium]
MQAQTLRTVLPAEQLKPIVNIPEEFAGKVLEVIIRPVRRRTFRSLSIIRIDTTTFKFDRDKANER